MNIRRVLTGLSLLEEAVELEREMVVGSGKDWRGWYDMGG